MKRKICTDIDQSKKLTELGIDINTADIIYNILDQSYIRHDAPIDKYHMPAWSLSALLGLIECDYNLEKTLFDQSDLFTYSIVCDNLDFRTYEYDDPLDAAFEMIVWLKENNNL